MIQVQSDEVVAIDKCICFKIRVSKADEGHANAMPIYSTVIRLMDLIKQYFGVLELCNWLATITRLRH